MKDALLTGSTGFVGHELLKALVEKTELEIFYLLVREKNKADNRLSKIIDNAGKLGKKIFFLEGDLIKKNLGLSEESLFALKEISEVYHLAAKVTLSNNNKEKIFKTNIEGTKNLLDLFIHSKNLKNFFYFSTAYVCGKQEKLVKEEWLGKPKAFRNAYEESKWFVEQLLQQYIKNFGMPIVTLRPTVIGTENKSKFNDVKKQTIYLHGTIIKKETENQNEDKKIRLFGKPDTFINLITIEDIVSIILKVRSLQNKSLIYNLANPYNCSAMSFLKGLQEIMGFKSGYEFVADLDKEKLSDAEKSIYEKTKYYFEYNLDTNLKWDTSNTNKIKKELNLISKDESWLKNHAREFFSTIKNEE